MASNYNYLLQCGFGSACLWFLLIFFFEMVNKMFICVGENDRNEKSFGIGSTIECAIKEWSVDTDHLAEYTEYSPTIYRIGDRLNIKIRVEFKAEES